MAPFIVLSCIMLGIFNILAPRPKDRWYSVFFFGIAMLCAWGFENAHRGGWIRQLYMLGWFTGFLCMLGGIAWAGIALADEREARSRVPRARVLKH